MLLAIAKTVMRPSLERMGAIFFKNQSLTFTEFRGSTCPFPGRTCALDKDPSLVLDTGYIHAKYLGINSEIPYHFRRITTCAPLEPDGDFLRIETDKSNRSDGYNHGADSVYDGHQTYWISNIYGRQKRLFTVTTETDITVVE